MKRILLSVLAAGLIAVAHAQVPGTLSYQGILVNSSGSPVADGTHYVQFRFYDDPVLSAGANLKYSSLGVGTGNDVATYKGMFTFLIGSGSTGNAAIPTNIWNSQLWVEVTADGAVLAPRIQLSSNAYAFKAQAANTMDAAGLTGTANLPTTVLDADLQDLADGSLTGSKIGTGINGANVTTGAVVIANGGTGSTTQAGARTNLGLGSISTLSAIGSTEITDLSIATADLAAGAVTGAKILDGTIDNADISASAAIADSKLATITTAGKVSGNAITSGTISGSLIGTGISATNVTTGTLPASVIPASVASGSGSGGQVGFWNGSNTLTGNAGLFWDNTNFRLGLGTIAPNRRLHLVGTGALDDDIVIEANAAASNAGAIRFVRSQGSFSTPTSALANDQLGSVTFAGYNGTSYTNSAEVFSNAETLFSTSASAYLGFSTASAGTLSEKMRITSAGTVGIGTATPAAGLRLDVNGSSIFRGYTGINRTTTLGGFSLFDIEGPGGASTYLGMNINGTNASSFPFYGYATAGLQRAWTYWDGATSTWKLNIGGTDRLTVSASGNLGIGTSPNASTKLDVEGGAVIGSTYAGTNAAPTNGLLVEGNLGLGTSTATYPVTLYNSTDARVVNIEQDYAGASTQYGMTVDMTSATGTGSKYGLDVNVAGTTAQAGSVYGLETDVIPNGTGTAYGVNSSISAVGTGIRYGILNTVSQNASNTSSVYGIYNSMSSAGTGTTYGIYNSGEDSNYFSGKVGINTVPSPTTTADLWVRQSVDFEGIKLTASDGASYWDIAVGATNDNLHLRFNGNTTTYFDDVTGAITPSDIRLKENINDLSNILPKLLRLNPKTYNLKRDINKKRAIGLIAQEVLPLFPEAVQKEDDGFYAMSYNDFGVLSIQGIKELHEMISIQQKQIEELKSKLSQYEGLSAQVEELKKMISGKSDEKSSGAVTVGSDKK